MGKNKKFQKREKVTNQTLLNKMKYDFSRDAEWFKRTFQKMIEVKEDLNKKFYNEEQKNQKLDFINKLKEKLKDYKNAIKFKDRYKKVRFVERRKLERKFSQIKKKIENEKDENKKKELIEEKNKIENDINYVKYYPKTYKYYSLFPLKDKDNKETIEKREKMRKKIQFFLNERKNKNKYKKNIKDNLSEDNEIEIDTLNNKNNNEYENEEKKEELINKIENKKNKQKKNKNTKDNTKKNKKIKDENEENDYENVPKKQFKDNFFELDE